jgi:hypothetical protein
MVRQLKKVFVMRPGRFEKKTVLVSALASGLLAGACALACAGDGAPGRAFLARQPTGHLANGESRFVTGQPLRINGGATT